MVSAAEALRTLFEDVGLWWATKFPAGFVILLVFVSAGKLLSIITIFVLAKTRVKPQEWSGQHLAVNEDAREMDWRARVTTGKPSHHKYTALPVGESMNVLHTGIGAFVAQTIRTTVWRGHMSMSCARMIGHCIHILMIIVGLVLALSYWGLQLAPIIAAAGLIGFAVSLALKDVLANSCAGLLLMYYDTVRPGDRIKILYMGASPDEFQTVAAVGMTKIVLWKDGGTKDAANVIVVPPQLLLSNAVCVQFAPNGDDEHAMTSKLNPLRQRAPHLQM